VIVMTSKLNRRRLARVAALLLALVLLMAGADDRGPRDASLRAASLSQTTATVRIALETTQLDVGQTTTATLRVDDIEELYGSDVRLAFDPQFIEVVDADPGRDGVQITPVEDFLQPDWILRQVADNLDGTVWYAATQLNPTEPVAGSGALAEFALRGRAAGATSIRVTYHKLVRRDGSQIETTAEDASFDVLVGGLTATPGPTPTRRATAVVTPEPSPTRTPGIRRTPPPTSTVETVEAPPAIYMPFTLKRR
jgi:hypothetical protein